MKASIGVSVLLGAASVSAGAVEFRVREISGQTVASPADSSLNFTIEARVVGETNAGIGSLGFDIRFAGEAENRGVLSRLRISEADGSYYQGTPSTSITGGAYAGMARQYRFLANINSAFNGLINTSAAVFTNTPDQELGLILAVSRTSDLLAPTGILVESQTDSSGFEPAPQQQFLESLSTGFGANGNWIEFYRFRYVVTDFAPRNLDLRLDNSLASTFTSLLRVTGSGFNDWVADMTNSGNAQVAIFTPSISVIPSPVGSGLICPIMLLGLRRRR